MKTDLKGLDSRETEEWVIGLGLEKYRAGQIRQWLFSGLAGSFDEMTNISRPVQGFLKEKANISHLETVRTQVSEDTTRKFLFRLHDGELIESVLIPEKDHYTACISSQAGCAMGCLFCLTARHGFKRNLTAAEIIDQIIQTRRSMDDPDSLTNIVLMGMGEPLANYFNVLKALNNILADDGLNFSHRKVTLSTSGLVPQIMQLGQDSPVNLAVSLNAVDDETRSFLMPVNRKFPLKSLFSALKGYPLPNRKMITFEYILINGINDRDEDARGLIRLLSGMKSKVNLIPFNSSPGVDMKAPSPEMINKFRDILVNNNLTAMIRKSKGQDISAACGQLSGEQGSEDGGF